MKISEILNTQGKKVFILIDPDKFFKNNYKKIISEANKNSIDLFLVGGSLISQGDISQTIAYIKQNSQIPICIFPGDYSQIDNNADGIFFLSLISGRNPDYLIGNHVRAVNKLKNSNLEIIPVGYILIDGDKLTSVHYISNTLPIPSDSVDIVVSTALAGQYLGMKSIYLEAGSGAKTTVSANIVKEVKQNINIPLIVGGGIKNEDNAESLFENGADSIVIGNAIEDNEKIISKICKVRNKMNKN